MKEKSPERGRRRKRESQPEETVAIPPLKSEKESRPPE